MSNQTPSRGSRELETAILSTKPETAGIGISADELKRLRELDARPMADTIKAKQREIDDLKGQKAKLEIRVGELKNGTTEKVSEQSAMIDMLQDEIKKLQETISGLLADIVELKEKLGNAERRHEGECGALNATISRRDKQINSLLDTVKQSDATANKALSLNQKAIAFGNYWKRTGAIAIVLSLFAAYLFWRHDSSFDKRVADASGNAIELLEKEKKTSESEKAMHTKYEAEYWAQYKMVGEKQTSIEALVQSAKDSAVAAKQKLDFRGKTDTETADGRLLIRLMPNGQFPLLQQKKIGYQDQAMVIRILLSFVQEKMQGWAVGGEKAPAFFFSPKADEEPRGDRPPTFTRNDGVPMAECLNQVLGEAYLKLLQEKYGDFEIIVYAEDLNDSFVKGGPTSGNIGLRFESGKFYDDPTVMNIRGKGNG